MIAAPIMSDYAWGCLPADLRARVRWSWCFDGSDSDAYRAVVAEARQWWVDHQLPEAVGR